MIKLGITNMIHSQNHKHDSQSPTPIHHLWETPHRMICSYADHIHVMKPCGDHVMKSCDEIMPYTTSVMHVSLIMRHTTHTTHTSFDAVAFHFAVPQPLTPKFVQWRGIG